MLAAAILAAAPPAVADDYNYVQQLVSYKDLHPSPAWGLTQWTFKAPSLEAAVIGRPDYDPATLAGDALGWQQGYGNYVLDFGYIFSKDMTLWHFGGINWDGEPNGVVFMRVSIDGENWSDPVQIRDVKPGGNELFVDTYSLDDFGVTEARYLKIEKLSGGAKTGKFIDAVGVAPESTGVFSPVAFAGNDQNADPGSEVILDASGSGDPNGTDDIFSFYWEQIDGRDVGLVGVHTETPFFNVPEDAVHGETFTFALTVTDRSGLTDSDEITVTAITRHPPTADAGNDQRVKWGALVTLDASGSTDPDNNIVRYQWVQTAGPSVTLSDREAVRPTFSAPDGASHCLIFRLTVTDATGLASQDEVEVLTADYTPVLAARVFDEKGSKAWISRSPDNAAAALGLPDYDPEFPGNQASGWDNNSGYMELLFDRAFTRGEGHDLVVYNFGPGEVNVAVSADGENWTELATLPATSAGGETLYAHRFDLDELSVPDQRLQLVRIDKPAGGPNTGRFIDAVEAYYAMAPGDNEPVAVASAPGRVEPGALVSLDGSRSFDPDGDLDAYTWEQIGGPVVTLDDADRAKARFSVPDDAAHGTLLEFQLTATDRNQNLDQRTVVLTVTTNYEPVADAGPDQMVKAATRIRLDGSGSHDPDAGDEIAFYRWEQIAGRPLIFDPAAERPLLDLPEDAAGETLVFELTVTDGSGLTDTDRIKVTIVDYDPFFADSVMSQSGCKSWATRIADGAVNTLGAPDYDPDVDGDQLSGWNYNNGQMTLEFRKIIADRAGGDFRIYHFGPGDAEVYVSTDGGTWQGPVVLPPTDAGGGDYYTCDDFELNDFGVSAAKFVRIVQTRSGPKTGRFIDAVEAFEAVDGPDSLTVVEGTTHFTGRGASEINLIDPQNDAWEWRESSGTQALSDSRALTPTFVAPMVADGETQILTFSLFLNEESSPYYQIQYTVVDNGISDSYLPMDAMPMETATEKRVGILHAGDLVSLSLLSDTDPAIPGLPGKPRNFIYGLVDVAQAVSAPGRQAALDIYFTTPLAGDYGWFAYNSEDGWFTFEGGSAGGIDGIEFNADRTRATLYITDGGGFDDDGKVNGVVVSSTGPALTRTQGQWLDKGGGEGGCFIRSLISH